MEEAEKIKEMKDRERQFRETDVPFEIFTVKSKTKWWSQIELQNVVNHLHLRKEGRVLDICCSDGRFLGYVHERFPEIKLFGIDFALNPLKTLHAKNFVNHPICGEVSQLAFKPDSFDYAAAIQAIYHPSREERMKVLKNVRNVLKSGGSLVVTVLNQKTWSHLVANGKAGPLITVKDFHVYLYNPDELREELTAAGFMVKDVIGINNVPVDYLKRLGPLSVFLDITYTRLFRKSSLARACYLLASCVKK